MNPFQSMLGPEDTDIWKKQSAYVECRGKQD